MAAKIGILGESTVVTNTTTTLYTVPSDKAARIRMLLIIEAHATDSLDTQLTIGTPGSEKTWQFYLPSDGIDMFTGIKHDGSDGYNLSEMGIHDVAGLNPDGGSQQWLNTPLPVDYFLSEGDTVTLRNNGDTWNDVLCQVHGVEDDA